MRHHGLHFNFLFRIDGSYFLPSIEIMIIFGKLQLWTSQVEAELYAWGKTYLVPCYPCSCNLWHSIIPSRCVHHAGNIINSSWRKVVTWSSSDVPSFSVSSHSYLCYWIVSLYLTDQKLAGQYISSFSSLKMLILLGICNSELVAWFLSSWIVPSRRLPLACLQVLEHKDSPATADTKSLAVLQKTLLEFRLGQLGDIAL